MSGLQFIPQELVIEIARHLDTTRDLLSLARTCFNVKEASVEALYKKAVISEPYMFIAVVQLGLTTPVERFLHAGMDPNTGVSIRYDVRHSLMSNDYPSKVFSNYRRAFRQGELEVTRDAMYSDSSLHPFHLAAIYGYHKITCLLLDHGGKLDVESKFSFLRVVKHGWLDYMPFMRGYHSWTPLFVAVYTASLHKGNEYGEKHDVAKAIMSRGFFLCSAPDNCHILHIATLLDNKVLVNYILSHHKLDIDINIRDSSGRTPLWCAYIKGEECIISSLLAHGADTNAALARDYTLLHDACRRRRYRMAALLIRYGCDVNASGYTTADSFGSPDVRGLETTRRGYLDGGYRMGLLQKIEAAEEYQAELTLVWDLEGYHRPLDILCLQSPGWWLRGMGGARARIGLIKMLLARGADTRANPLSKGSWPPIFVAAAAGDARVVQLLIEAGADLSFDDSQNIGILEAALFWTLISQDSRRRIKSHKDLIEVVKVLLNGGAVIGCRDSTGATELMRLARFRSFKGWRARRGYAVLKHHELRYRLAEMLIEAGADINARDRHGNTSLSLAYDSYLSLGVFKLRKCIPKVLQLQFCKMLVDRGATMAGDEPTELDRRVRDNIKTQLSWVDCDSGTIDGGLKRLPCDSLKKFGLR
jgi:ankyrin repeat protein